MKIVLHEMVFFGFHGVYSEERTLGQRFIVNIELKTDSAKDIDINKLEDTVDYTKVYDEIKHIMVNEQFQLLENCANSILNTLLAKFDLVEEVTVAIKKPSVAIQGNLSYSEIEMTRGR